MPACMFSRGVRPGWALVAVLALAACTTPPAEPPPDPPNFVFVLIDTLRADHVGAYGYERDTTPFIDSLAEDGLVFEHTVAQAPWTGSSMASIWTSRYPSEVGAGVQPDETGSRFLAKTGSTKLRRGVPTVAELLAKSGYRTIGIVSNAYAGGFFGLLRGFQMHAQKRQDAAGVTDAAIQKLDMHLAKDPADPFFLYVHYIDAHEPTFPPQEHQARFPSDSGEPHDRAHAGWRFHKGEARDDSAFETFREHKIDLYDASIHFIDTQIARLARHLEEVGMRHSTVFIVASDHGEEFWEHTDFEKETHLDPRGISGVGHGQSLFGELTDVPLVVSGPGVPAGRVSELVRNLDVAPTILALAQADAGGLGLRGIDLVGAVNSGAVTPLDGFSESIAYGVEAKSLESGGWKLIRYSDTKTGRTEFLFDRGNDRGEHVDRSKDSAEQAERLLGVLDATLAGLDTMRGEKTKLDADTRSQLKAIGYIE